MSNGNRDEGTSIPISEGSRDVVKKMKDHDLLSMGRGESDSQNKDIYLLAVAMGLGSPTEKMTGAQSWTRVNYFQTEDVALLKAILLATADGTKDITPYCDTKAAFDYSRQFTDAGFKKLDEFAADALYDKDLLVRNMLDYVESMYDKIVDGNT